MAKCTKDRMILPFFPSLLRLVKTILRSLITEVALFSFIPRLVLSDSMRKGKGILNQFPLQRMTKVQKEKLLNLVSEGLLDYKEGIDPRPRILDS
ncbi:hypothetical protein LguiA_035933 [Lonicera macranthoides]